MVKNFVIKIFEIKIRVKMKFYGRRVRALNI